MLAALQERTQYRPTTGLFDLQLGSSLGSEKTMYSLHSVEPWVVRIAEGCWSSANLCLLTSHRWEKDLGILHRSWLTDGHPLCGWARATSQTSIWSELSKEVCMRAACDDSLSTAGQKKTSEQLSRHRRSRRRRLRTSHLQLNPSHFLTRNG